MNTEIEAGAATGTQDGAASTETPAPKQDQQTQQPKQEGTQPDAAQGEQATATAPVPVEVTLPEGVVADEGLLAALKETAKDSTGAQKLVDAYVALEQRAAEAKEQERAGWKQEIAADKGIDLKRVERAMGRYGTDKLREALNATGLGDHPEFVRFFNRVGQDMANDSIAGTSGGGGNNINSREEMLRRHYPSAYKE